MRKQLWTFLIPLVVLLSIGSVYAGDVTITLGNITSGDTITLVKGINASVTWGEDDLQVNVTNMTYYYSYDSGSTWYSIGKDSKVLLNGTNNSEIAWTTTGVYDANSPYDIKVVGQYWNATDASVIPANVTSASITDVYIDNSVPVCSILIPSSTTTYATGISLTATATNSSSCQITVGDIYTGAINGTAGAENCYKLFGDGYPSEGFYDTVTFRVGDGINTTSCTSSSVTFDDEGRNIGVSVSSTGGATATGGAGTASMLSSEQQQKLSSNSGLIGIIVIGVGLYYLSKKKK